MSLLESPVHIVRESISVITQILSSKNIPVYQRGLEAYVAYDPITGEANHVCLPYLPDNASDRLVFAVQGFLDHEVGHILFTDSKAIVNVAHDKQLVMMHNVFEDPFVEKGMRGKFYGTANNLNKLFEFFLDTVVEKNYQALVSSGETSPIKYFSVLAPAITRAWHDVFVFSEYMKQDDKWKRVQPIIDLLPKGIAERTLNSKSTQENIDIARDVLAAIERGASGLSDDSKADEDEDGDSGDGSSSIGDGSTSSKGSSDGIVDEEGDDDSEPRDEEGDDSEPHDEEGDESDDEGDDDPEPRDESDDEEGESDESDSDGSGAGSAGEDESESSDGAATGSDEEDESEEDDETESESVHGDDGEDESEEDDDAESDDSEIAEEVEIGDISDLKVSDLESGVSDEIGKLAVTAIGESEYSVFTTDHDDVSTPEFSFDRYSESELNKATDEMIKKVEDMASIIQADLQRAFISENKSYWQGSQYSGKINSSSLSRLFVGDVRVFRKKVEHKTQDYDVSIVIDCSGSMNSRSAGISRMESAMMAAYAIGAALDAIGVNYELIGFTSKDVDLGETTVRAAEAKTGKRYSRTGALYMPIFKSFDEQWSPEIWRRLALFTIDSRYMSENADGECVMIAAKRLMTQPSSGKAMIVLSDGQPSCYGAHGADTRAQANHLRNVVKDIADAGIKIFGIGIQSEAVRHFYPQHAVLTDIRKLPEEIIGRVSDVLLGN